MRNAKQMSISFFKNYMKRWIELFPMYARRVLQLIRHSYDLFESLFMYIHIIFFKCVYACTLCIWCVLCMSFYNPVPTSNSGNWELQKRRWTWDSFFFLFLLFLFSKISPRMSSFPYNTPSKSTFYLSFPTFFLYPLHLLRFFHFAFPFFHLLAGYYPLNPQAR